MAEPFGMKKKFYDWTNEMLAQSPFDGKINHLMSMVAALALGNEGAVSYFYFAAKQAGAPEAELTAAADIAVSATGLNLYTLLPKSE